MGSKGRRAWKPRLPLNRIGKISPKTSAINPILPLLLLLALATLSTRLFSLPLNRVIESRYCAEYYNSSTPPPESQCKIDWVQKRLAWLQGVIETAVIGVDLGVAVPAAWVGDRWRKRGRGRRVVLAANLAGWAGVVGWVVIVGHLDGALPVSAMAAAPFFALIGGHDCVLHSAVFAIVTDLTDDLVQRTSYIAYISSVNYVVSLFGPSLASAAMTINLWLPFYLSIGFLGAALPVVYFLPLGHGDEQDRHGKPSPATRSAAAKDDDDLEAEPLLSRASSSSSSSQQQQPLSARLLHLLHRRPHFLLLLSSFLLTSLASSNTHLLPQYMSARYHRSFASVGPLLSLKAATNIILLTFVVPIGMRVLLMRQRRQQQQRESPEQGRERDEEGNEHEGASDAFSSPSNANHNPATVSLNINAALLSLAISVLGALSIAVAPRVTWLVCALLLYALGSALPVFTMALVEAVDGGKGKGDGVEPSRRGDIVNHGEGALHGEDENDGESNGSSSALADEAPHTGRRGPGAQSAHPTSALPTSPAKTAGTSGGAARVYTVVMVVKTIGTLVGAPLMTAVWVAGINLNDGGGGSGAGLGLPFYVSAVLYLCAMGVIWCLKL